MKKIEIISNWIENQGLKRSKVEVKAGLSNGYIANMLKTNSEISADKLSDILKAYPELESELELTSKTTPGDQLRLNKAITPTEDEGLYYIPIAAQAGYALHYQDPMYLNELERLYIPGNPFKGDRFRYFEIEGDSMYPTLKDGMQVIAEKVEPEYWKQIADYYIYIVVTVDQVLAKRLIKIDDDLLAMVSDNDELYPQQELKYTDVKEIWRVKRKLDWEMPPPRRIELKIDKKK